MTLKRWVFGMGIGVLHVNFRMFSEQVVFVESVQEESNDNEVLKFKFYVTKRAAAVKLILTFHGIASIRINLHEFADALNDVQLIAVYMQSVGHTVCSCTEMQANEPCVDAFLDLIYSKNVFHKFYIWPAQLIAWLVSVFCGSFDEMTPNYRFRYRNQIARAGSQFAVHSH